MTEFTESERRILEDMVRQRKTRATGHPWLQRHRARAIEEEAQRLIGALPKPRQGLRGGDTEYYTATARVRAQDVGGRHYKIHEAGADGRPICVMGQSTDWKGDYLGAGPVTCGKCAATRNQ
jgi:hypothetical protein